MAMKFTEEQLNSFDKSMLIQLFLNQQEQLEKVSADLHSLDTKMQAMMEQLILANKNRFGRSSEKLFQRHGGAHCFCHCHYHQAGYPDCR